MSKELKPCPFCGGAASIQNGPSYIWYAECGNCGVDGKIKHDEKEAITAWNRRASQQVPEGWREFLESCSTFEGYQVNGNTLSRKAKELLSAAPAGGETGEG